MPGDHFLGYVCHIATVAIDKDIATVSHFRLVTWVTHLYSESLSSYKVKIEDWNVINYLKMSFCIVLSRVLFQECNSAIFTTGCRCLWPNGWDRSCKKGFVFVWLYVLQFLCDIFINWAQEVIRAKTRRIPSREEFETCVLSTKCFISLHIKLQ